jgi:hypothetical protein
VTFRRRRWVAAAMAPLVALALGGCQKVTRKVGSSVSPCFRVLPQAHQALGGQGSFVDVARVRGGPAGRFGPVAATPTTATTAPAMDVCVVAYRGPFDPERIGHLVGAARQGRYALVVVGVRSERVRAVALSDRLPSPLHAH